ncbi:MAG: tRNA (adenosine(37)-N6)-threonylcarbamoyltransferase complex dimerization subunit type 1 TsaB [Clostridia bacterium]|nr:tRNA (adenosine(37)-N6)-threonylcarbamoyltransferase complex dimerization subunit type 1 TsaB [Clostridia bacterium]
MKILAAECSAVSASCALTDNGKTIATSFVNLKLTHSQTLLPMIKAMLDSAKTDIKDIDGFCISSGPGSFTGIRIGISAVKGMAAPEKKPCVGVSTLLAMAYNYADTDCIACCVMDARCSQVYNAMFRIENGVITRLCDDRALLCEELAKDIKENYSGEKIIVIGDGTSCFAPFADDLNVILSHPSRRFQTAEGVAQAAYNDFLCGNTTPPEQLLPTYLRLPQAERELKAKKGDI